jgi:hypothetical protein
MTSAQRNQFLLLNPRKQLIRKTDLAKVECCFNLNPEIACKGAEKAFTAFAEFITEEWADDQKRSTFVDDWFKAAVARVILFRAAEVCVSKAAWYKGGYRAQIVAYTCARLSQLAADRSKGGKLDYARIWAQQSAGALLEKQMGLIGEAMAKVILHPPLAGKNISDWAKLQACRKNALEASVNVVEGFDEWIASSVQRQSDGLEQGIQGLLQGLRAVRQVCDYGAAYWTSLREFGRQGRILSSFDEKALFVACELPKTIPTEEQAMRLLPLINRATASGWKAPRS